ncbi:MAG: Gfo/Idh/MocA family protein [Candidatus Bathyarchaeia archaeon]
MPSIKIGIVGCGGISYYHMNHLLRIPEADVVAISDINKSNMSKLRKAFPRLLRCCETFTDYKDMLSTVKLEAVEILTPHALHFEQALECLNRDLHLLIEKPMVCTVKQAKELIAEIEEKKKVVLVSYQRHYQPQFRYIKKLIESGEIGEVQFISAMQCQDWMNFTKGTWRQDPKMGGGGPLIDSASHLLDVILWVTGLQPSEVVAFTDNLGTPVDVNSSISVKFSNDAQASIGIVGNSPCWEENITIWGSKGVVFYRNGRVEHLLFGGKVRIEPVKLPEASNPDKNFVNAILGKEENQAPPTCGLKVIELTEAIWESAKSGKKTKVTCEEEKDQASSL